MAIQDEIKKRLSSSETWRDRVRAGILLTSPSGIEFEALWIGDEVTKNKRLQMLAFAHKNRQIVKDYGTDSDTWPISFMFTGIDNDKVSQKFWDACDETGQWGVVHPVRGFKSLQLVSVTMQNRPVESGNITEISADWILPQNEEAINTGRELGSMSDALGLDLNNSSALSFIEKLQAGTEAFRKGVAKTVETVSGISNKVLGPIGALSDTAFSSFLAVQGGINDIRNATVFEALAICGQIQNLIQIPLRATNDHRTRNAACAELATNIFSIVDNDDNDIFARNDALIAEVASLALASASSEVATSSILHSVNDAVNFISTYQDIISTIVYNMEVTQEKFKDNYCDEEFVFGSNTHRVLNTLESTTISYIRAVANNLKAEKRLILSRPMTPLMIVLAERGNDDSYVDFLSVNNLSGDDIIILNTGREVIV